MRKPLPLKLILPLFLFLIFAAIPACKKSTATTTGSIPLVTTNSTIINLTSTTAQSGGVVDYFGDAAITANGVCYSASNSTPTIADLKTSDAVVNQGVEDVPFTSSLTNLTPNTTYYLSAYATNPTGTGYGSVIKFTTSSSLTSVTGTVTTFAGNGTPGYADGTATAAMFNNPQGVSIDAAGNVYVSDSYNNYIRKITPAGTVTTVAGNGTLGYTDGPAASAEFYDPMGSTFDSQGNLYIADYGNNVIREITPEGVVSTYCGNGTAGYVDGSTAASIEFNSPSDVVFDSSGDLLVTDRGNNLIRKITPAGVVTTVAGIPTSPSAGYVDGTLSAAAFNKPNALVIDASNNLYVADQANAAIRKVTTPGGVTTTIAGGPIQVNLLNIPVGIAIDKAGNLYVVDESGRIFEYTSANVLYLLAGTINTTGFANGSGAAASFSQPQGIAIDASGNIYVADKGNNCIRKIVISSTASQQ